MERSKESNPAENNELLPSSRSALLTPLEVASFTALAALLAIGADAAIGHAMMWGNDPFWSYWVTDTLLIVTVFALGTAWSGVGAGRGAVLTAVHITLLTGYYWSLAPIGLPGQPEWLDLQRTWVTGLPIHFAVYYLGYLVALWLWRRREDPNLHRPSRVGRLAGAAALASIAIVVATGLLQALLLGEFPGVTWFIMRTAVATPFTLAWWSLAGRDRAAAISGGVGLGLLLTAYTHFLAPVGLPNASFRLLAENPPPAAVHWLTYRQEFLLLLPITILLSAAGYLVALRPPRSQHPNSRRQALALGFTTLFLIATGAAVTPFTGPEAASATITAHGQVGVSPEPADNAALATGSATLQLDVTDRNTHRTPLAPHDLVNLTAEVTGPGGTQYRLDAAQPMVAEPRGLFTTWHGVGFGVWHHGRSGIGYAAGLPATFSNVAVYALGDVSSGAQVLATGVPMHVFTSERDGARLELHVGDALSPVAGLPGGYLRVVWSEYGGGHGAALLYARYALGAALLLALLGFALAGALRRPFKPQLKEA